MKRNWNGAVAVFVAMTAGIGVLSGQAPKADWLTDGGDPQRTAWQRNETILTKANVKDMKLLWKIQLDNQPRQMHNLFPPLIAGSVSTPSGDKEIAVVAGVSDNVYGDRRRDRAADLEEQVRQHVPGADAAGAAAACSVPAA